MLTYLNAFEFEVDLSGGEWTSATDMVEGRDFREIELVVLEQQEGITYTGSGRSFIYTTEAGSPDGIPIMQVDCAD